MISTRPKKSLGQHFLTSQGALLAIITASNIGKNDTILEIGPGKGVLTRKLLDTAGRVIAVEKDSSLVLELQKTFQSEIMNQTLTLIEGDILDFDISTLNTPYKLVANIPYYITGEIIRKFLTTENKPKTLTLLVQKEVAERIVAKDGKESVLSLSVKFFGTPTYIQTVKKGSFNPPPKVDSAILKIEIKSKDEKRNTKDEKTEEKFFEMIKAGFKSKRKKLISNLSPLYDKGALSRAFEELGWSENVRAEDISPDQWTNLLSLMTRLNEESH
jgi:16S rRNA (adenine1518-N6/adenine1519-N6)-dimethyltransferase